jgi:hypothetical protein
MCRWRSPTRRWSPTRRSRSRPPVLNVPLEEAEAPLEGSPPRTAIGGRKGPSSSGFDVKRKGGGAGSTTMAAGFGPGDEVDDLLSPDSFP